jgi:hypothetical protein
MEKMNDERDFWVPAFVFHSIFVASHTCTVYSLLQQVDNDKFISRSPSYCMNEYFSSLAKMLKEQKDERSSKRDLLQTKPTAQECDATKA